MLFSLAKGDKNAKEMDRNFADAGDVRGDVANDGMGSNDAYRGFGYL